MLLLVLTDGHEIGLIQQNVGGHQNRIGKQPDRGPFAITLALILKLRHPLELAHSRDAGEYPCKLGMCRYIRLDKNRRFLSVDSSCQVDPCKIERLLP